MRDARSAFLVAFALLAMLATAVWAQGVPAPVPTTSVTVSNPIEVFNDGGFQARVLNRVHIESDGGFGVTVTSPVTLAQPISVYASDGGLGVVVRSPLEALPDGGVALGVAVPEPVRVIGPTYGEVLISGTVNLSSATLASMGNLICTAAESHRLSLSTTPTIVPSGPPISGRTSWTLVNVDTVGTKTVACRVDPGDGGVPDCTTPGFGLTVFPNGGTLTFPVRESDTVRCRACTAATTVEHTEEACVAP